MSIICSLCRLITELQTESDELSYLNSSSARLSSL